MPCSTGGRIQKIAPIKVLRGLSNTSVGGIFSGALGAHSGAGLMGDNEPTVCFWGHLHNSSSRSWASRGSRVPDSSMCLSWRCSCDRACLHMGRTPVLPLTGAQPHQQRCSAAKLLLFAPQVPVAGVDHHPMTFFTPLALAVHQHRKKATQVTKTKAAVARTAQQESTWAQEQQTLLVHTRIHTGAFVMYMLAASTMYYLSNAAFLKACLCTGGW